MIGLFHIVAIGTLALSAAKPATAAPPKGAEAADQQLPVICPALFDSRLPTWAVNPAPAKLGKPYHPPPQLVVLGKCVPSDAKEADEHDLLTYTLHIERVLYGSSAEKAIRLLVNRQDWDFDPKRGIFAVSPSYVEGFPACVLHYQTAASEQRAEIALGQARLDYAALTAESIIVGAETEVKSVPDSNAPWVHRRRLHRVKVARMLGGDPLETGREIWVEVLAPRDGQFSPIRTDKAEKIYFVVGRADVQDANLAYYQVYTRLPVGLEPKVRESLAGRERHPVVQIEHRRKKVKVREVIYQGSDAESLELLGALDKPAIELGYRTLIHRWESARPTVLAAIEKELFRFELPDEGEEEKPRYQRLRNAIYLLGWMEEKHGENDLQRLIEAYFAYIEGGPPGLPAEVKPATFGGIENFSYTNQSFLWLLLQLGHREAREKYGDRLLALRDKATGHWRQLVQNVLNVLRVKDVREVKAAMARIEGTHPVRSKTGLRHPRSARPRRPQDAYFIESGEVFKVLFSADGTRLATVAGRGICLWKTDAWALVASIPADRFVELGAWIPIAESSPDGKFLYVAFNGADGSHVARFNFATGQLDRQYGDLPEWILRVELSADGRTMVTAGSHTESLVGDVMTPSGSTSWRWTRVWDVETGRLVRSVRGDLRIAPNRTGLWRTGRVTGRWEDYVEPFRGGKPMPFNFPGKRDTSNWITTPDGRLLCCATPSRTGKSVTLGVYRLAGSQAAELASSDFDIPSLSQLTISADGEMLAASAEHELRFRSAPDGRQSIWLLSLPELERLGTIPCPPKQHYLDPAPGSLALSPDGKLLAMAMAWVAPALVRTDTRQALIPYDGHQDRVLGLYFFDEGNKVRSIGTDHQVCIWDAGTLQMLQRFPLPANTRLLGVREPDGKYAICGDAAQGPPSRGKSKEPVIPAQVVDTDTGNVVCRVALPEANYSVQFHWLDDRRALADNGRSLTMFDYHSGEILRRLDADRPNRYPLDRLVLSEDRKALLGFGVPVQDQELHCRRLMRIDLETGNVTVKHGDLLWQEHGYFPIEVRLRGGRICDGHDIRLAGLPSSVAIFDRSTGKPITYRRFQFVECLDSCFSEDGARFAVLTTEQSLGGDESFGRFGTPTVVRVYDSMTGRFLVALPASAARFLPRNPCHAMTFSPSGDRIAFANGDGTIEIWPLPETE